MTEQPAEKRVETSPSTRSSRTRATPVSTSLVWARTTVSYQPPPIYLTELRSCCRAGNVARECGILKGLASQRTSL